MRRVVARVVSTAGLFIVSTALSSVRVRAQDASSAASAQAIDLSAARPGRAPSQPIDSAYTKKIHEYTTEPFFLSPLIDYMPASATVPTPTAILGDIAGNPSKLPYSKEVYDYMRLLAKSSPRVRVYTIGHTEEGREMIAVAVASESLLKNMDANRERLAKLADPRTIGMDDAKASTLIEAATPIYYITGTIHSPETGAPTALMELAYRLAVDESPYVRNIREHIITLITPVVEVDGRDREVDVTRWHAAHPGETYPNLIYWGHYVAHDNNRDQMAMTLKLSQNVLNTLVDWKAQVLHDLHESGEYLYDNTDSDGAYNPWFDPILINEWHMLAWNNVQELGRYGMPGVYTHGHFDNWSPGYLESLAATHNSINRLYETFGNGGTPETMERTLSPEQTSRTWWRPNPPLPRVMWSIRNNNNYEESGLLVSLNYFSTNRRLFLQNFYEKSKRSILKARTEGPAAYVLSADDRRLGAQADLLRVLQLQRVEISRTTAPMTLQLPAKHASSGHRNGGDTASAVPTAATSSATRTFPAGSYVVRMDQPFSRAADALLDYEYYSPNDPQKTPYDDTGWTFPELFATSAVRITDPKVLDTPMQVVKDTVRAIGGVSGSGSVFAINHNGDNALATLRYRFKAADFEVAEAPFTAGGVKFNRGSFIIRKLAKGDLDNAAKELGIRAVALDAEPQVKMHPARAARVAILHTWTGTQTEGWWRQAFDFLHIPFDYISVQDVAKLPNMNLKYDVIVFPPAGGSVSSIVEGLPLWRNAMPWKNTPLTPNVGTWAQTDDIRPGLGWQGLANLQGFVARGGVVITSANTTEFLTTYGLASGLTVNRAERGEVIGSVLRTRVVDATSPIVYGIPDSLGVYSADGASLSVSSLRGGGRGDRFGTGDTSRASGRGTLEDPDIPQGREQLAPENQAEVLPASHKWESAPLSSDQLRSPLNIIPPDQRPRVALRFESQHNLLVAGLLNGGNDIAERALVVDVPSQKGHYVVFANNPIYRGETIGSYFLVFNTLLNFDNLNAGRVLDAK
jgi:hypothetical protein